MKCIYVLYHAPCFDGTAAAFAAWEKFQDNAIYIPVTYHQPVPDMALGPNTTVYLVDFSYPRAVLEDLKSKVGRLVVIDHHDTAQKDLEGLDNCIFDMEKAGCILAWEYFHPNEPIPLLLKYIADRDLWRFEGSKTKALIEGLRKEIQYHNFDHFNTLCGLASVKRMIELGQPISEYNTDYIQKYVASERHYRILSWNGYRVALFNNHHLVDELCEAFYKNEIKALGIEISCCYRFLSSGDLKLSFRSENGTEHNTLDISEELGGGGHFNASATVFPLEEGLKLLQLLYSKDLVTVCLDEAQHLVEI